MSEDIYQWAKAQYAKVHDFVIDRRLYKGADKGQSNADILIQYCKILEGRLRARTSKEHVELYRAHREIINLNESTEPNEYAADLLHRFIDLQQALINKLPIRIRKLNDLIAQNREIAVELSETIDVEE